MLRRITVSVEFIKIDEAAIELEKNATTNCLDI